MANPQMTKKAEMLEWIDRTLDGWVSDNPNLYAEDILMLTAIRLLLEKLP